LIHNDILKTQKKSTVKNTVKTKSVPCFRTALHHIAPLRTSYCLCSAGNLRESYGNSTIGVLMRYWTTDLLLDHGPSACCLQWGGGIKSLQHRLG